MRGCRPTATSVVLLAALSIHPLPAPAAVLEDSRWIDQFVPPEINGTILDAAEFRGGLAVCGSFMLRNREALSSTAWWDGAVWHGLGTDPAEGSPKCLVTLGDSLMACTWFEDPVTGQDRTSLTRWDGRDWRSFGGVLDGQVRAMVILGGELVVGGSFLSAGGTAIGPLARWDGATWHAFPGEPNGDIDRLLADDDALIVAGSFTSPGAGIARWDGQTWLDMSNGLPPGLAALCTHDGSVVAGGTNPTPMYTTGWISMWDGAVWQPLFLGAQTIQHVGSLASVDGRLAFSGWDDAPNRYDVACRYIGILDGSTWSQIAFSTTDWYGNLKAWGHDLVVLGVNYGIGNVAVLSLAAWNGLDWRAVGDLGNSIAGPYVSCIANVDGLPVVGGRIKAVGTTLCDVASWNGQEWTGHRLSDRPITAILSSGGHTYVIGTTEPLAISCGSLAWRSCDYSISRPWSESEGAYALAQYSHSLCVGFDACEDLNVVQVHVGEAYVAPLNGGVTMSLCAWSDNLYAGRDYQSIHDVRADWIMGWDGVAWREPGDGLNGPVLALAAWGGSLVAGGQFTQSGQLPVSRVAAWDGAQWRALGDGFNNAVRALAVVGDRLYAGGLFTASGDTPMMHVARWDGACWQPLGSGTNGPVNALQGIGTDLWVGGEFTRAGDKSSLRIARWDDAPVPVHLSAFTARRERGGARIEWRVAEAAVGSRYQVWREPAGQSRSSVGVPLVGDRVQFTVLDVAPPAGAVAYWLQESTTDGAANWYGPAQLEAAPIPAALRFGQNHPNPFNPRTTFSYSLPRAGHVTLAIHDVRGARIATLVDAELLAGEQSGAWDGLDARGAAVPSGVYFARLATPSGTRAVKVTLAR